MKHGPLVTALFIVVTAIAFVVATLLLGVEAPPAGQGGVLALVIGIVLVPILAFLGLVLVRGVFGGRA